MNSEALERISLLAIAWDRKVQVAKLVKSELNESGNPEVKESGKWTLKVCGKWTLESAAVGLAWLDDQVQVLPPQIETELLTPSIPFHCYILTFTLAHLIL